MSEDGVVGAAVEADDDFLTMHAKVAAGLDELSVEMFGFHGGAALQALREPAVAAVGQDGQDDVGVDV